jgi:hypothetical protein
VVKIGRLRWMGQLVRMQELDPCRKLALLEPGKPTSKLRWLESVEEELKKIDWRRKSQDGEEWRKIMEEAKVHHGL